MEIRTTYIGILEGVHGIWCGFKPANAEITEEKLVLYPEANKALKNKETGDIELGGVIISKKSDKSKYEEIDIPEENKE